MRTTAIPPEELERKAQELYEKSQTRNVVRIIQEIDAETGQVLSTKAIQPTIYKSKEAARKTLEGLRLNKGKVKTEKKTDTDDGLVTSIGAIINYQDSAAFTEDEKEYLTKRKQEYESYYEFETPFDRNILNYVLLEELNLYRLYAKLPYDSGDGGELSEKISKGVKRLSTYAADLKIKSKKDKADSQEPTGFAQLSKEFDKRDGKMLDDETEERWSREEEELLVRRRGKAILDDVDFVPLDEDEPETA